MFLRPPHPLALSRYSRIEPATQRSHPRSFKPTQTRTLPLSFSLSLTRTSALSLSKAAVLVVPLTIPVVGGSTSNTTNCSPFFPSLPHTYPGSLSLSLNLHYTTLIFPAGILSLHTQHRETRTHTAYNTVCTYCAFPPSPTHSLQEQHKRKRMRRRRKWREKKYRCGVL